MRIRLVTAGAGAAWEAALVQACQAGAVPAEILHRCYDLGDLLAVAAAGQAEAAVVAAGTRWLDHDALARLAAAGLAVVGVAPAGDEDSERRLRQLGLHHVGADTDPPASLVDLTRAALSAEPAPDPPAPPDAPPLPDHDLPHVLLAVWGPKGAPGRTTVAVNLAFEAAPPGRRGPAGRRRHLRIPPRPQRHSGLNESSAAMTDGSSNSPRGIPGRHTCQQPPTLINLEASANSESSLGSDPYPAGLTPL
jgi:hypothetical protein